MTPTETATSTATPSASPSYVPPTTFTPGSLVLARIGDGSAPLGAVTVAMFIDEYTMAGARVQAVPLPTVAGALRAMSLPPMNPLTCVAQDQLGAPGSVGLLTRSADGRFVTLAGINTALGAVFQYQAIASGDPGPNVYQWVLARVAFNASVDTNTLISDHYGGECCR
jgi:hypothetical protein